MVYNTKVIGLRVVRPYVRLLMSVFSVHSILQKQKYFDIIQLTLATSVKYTNYKEA
jgi:hypothetical protein